MDCLVHDPFYEEVLQWFGMPLEALFEQKSKAAWLAFERGHISEAEFAPRYFNDGRMWDYAGLKRVMRDNYRLLPGVADLLDDLATAGCEMHALSNYPRWYEMVESATGLSRWLRWSFVSCKTQLRKPEPAAYLGAAASLGVAPAKLVFIDDRTKNCAGARAVGMAAIHANDAGQIRKALAELGVPGA